MDIYTASQRIAQTFEVDGSPLRIGQHGVVGEGFTCAFIGINGSVDWLCFPDFDSPSVFAAILDREAGGFFRISPEWFPA